jgi:hypothetical protein
LNGGTVGHYVPATMNPVIVYQDVGQTAPNPNPMLLDSAGTCVVFRIGQFREIV